jgi:hypothetical protein
MNITEIADAHRSSTCRAAAPRVPATDVGNVRGEVPAE